MKYCKMCEMVFDEPIANQIGIADFLECPYCHSSDIVDTMPCAECGEPITGEYVLIHGDIPICDECYVVQDILA